MRPRKVKPDPEAKAKLLAEVRRHQDERSQGYRERAMKLFPHICGRCGKDFSGPNMRELTVHHKDGNHNNNPADGSNWELLCRYCHDDEHQKTADSGIHFGSKKITQDDTPLGSNPFAALKDKLGQ